MTTPACPKCRQEVDLRAVECPSCGLVFAKWRPKDDGPPSAPPMAGPQVDAQARTQTSPATSPTPTMPVGLYLEGRFLRWGRFSIALWILSFVADLLLNVFSRHPVPRMTGFADLLLVIGILLFGFGGVMATIRENAPPAQTERG